jgi:tRNA(Ile)-lysidine synthase
MFLEILEQTAKEKCGLRVDLPILVGVSGGADSLALMHGLNTLGYKLVIAHLDHALRPESRQDSDFVEELAGSSGITFVSQRVDVRTIAEEQGQSLEEAARQVRYEFLFKQARDHHVQAVAVAHHADDQVETVLMHFLRGAALSGLSGMAYRRVLGIWDEEIPLVRPLLDLWREDIENYVSEIGLQPRVDLSNRDPTYFRNRLRHELIPALETYNPQIRKVIQRMTEVLGEEDRFLDDLAEKAWLACFISQTGDWVELHYPAFLSQAKAMQRRVLRRAIAHLRPDLRDVGFEAVERGLAFVENPPESREIDLVARLNLVFVDEILIVKTWSADLPDWDKPLLLAEDYQRELAPGESVNLRHEWEIEATVLADEVEGAVSLAGQLSDRELWLDLDRLQLPLTVRGREEGERWQPLGLGGHSQKLSDFLINEKVPDHLRDIWPLVCSESQIAWVVGLRPSEVFKVTDKTKHILHLKLVKK